MTPHLHLLVVCGGSSWCPYEIALGSEIWNVVDVIVVIGLIASIFTKQKPAKFKP